MQVTSKPNKAFNNDSQHMVFYYALVLQFKMVCGGFYIALLIP